MMLVPGPGPGPAAAAVRRKYERARFKFVIKPSLAQTWTSAALCGHFSTVVDINECTSVKTG